MLTGDLMQVNYIIHLREAALLEFRRRCEAIQHGVIMPQFCCPVWNAWMDHAVLSGSLELSGYAKDRHR
jgi:capsid protein